MNKRTFLLVTLILGATYFFIPKKGAKKTTPQVTDSAKEKAPSLESAPADGEGVDYSDLIARASDPEERAERLAMQADPDEKQVFCTKLDDRAFCLFYDVPKERRQGIKVHKGQVFVRAEAQEYLDEARKALAKKGEVSPDDEWMLAFWFFLDRKLEKNELPYAQTFSHFIQLDEVEGDKVKSSKLFAIPKEGLPTVLKFFEREYPLYRSGMDFSFFKEARKLVFMQDKK
jgi:hypothetical protein